MAYLFTIAIRAIQLLWIAFRVFLSYQFHYLACLFYTNTYRLKRRNQLHRSTAVRIRESAIRMRGIYIKLGQMMSTRIDLLPLEYIEELSVLQDQVPPADIDKIRKRVVTDLGAEIDQLFTSFSSAPIAAASLGQVHEAYLRQDNRRVAVKVQYPDIQKVIAIDLKMSWWVTALMAFWFPHVRFDVLYREFSRIVQSELDYIQEGHNAERFSEKFAEDKRIITPKVLWDYSSSHVLTLEFLEGIKIDQAEQMQGKGLDLKAVAGLLAESYMCQILEHRFFHGDPHPGNLFVQADKDGSPQLVFLDFGQMQDITPQMNNKIKATIRAIILRDTQAIVLGLVDLGFIDRGQDLRDIEQAVDFFMTRYRDMKPREFRELTIGDIAQDVAQLFKISPLLQIPNHFILFARTAMMLNGLCSRLDPDLNIIDLAKPHAQRFILEDSTDILQLLGNWKETGRLLLNLPARLDDFLTTAKTQGVRTHMSSPDISHGLNRLLRLGHRALIGLSLMGMAFLYSHFKQQAMQTEALVTAISAGALFLVFLWSLIKPP